MSWPNQRGSPEKGLPTRQTSASLTSRSFGAVVLFLCRSPICRASRLQKETQEDSGNSITAAAASRSQVALSFRGLRGRSRE